MQGFIQVILMSGRGHKKLNLLNESKSSYNFILKHIKTDLCQTCIQNKLACYISSILSYLFALQM